MTFHYSTLAPFNYRALVWDVEACPSTVGWLTEYFRRMPGTYRFDHYSHSVAARGVGAWDFVAGHPSLAGLKSGWGRFSFDIVFGTHSPMYKAYQADGKLLMLGVDYDSSTYVHLVESIYRNRRRAQGLDVRNAHVPPPPAGEYWDRAGGLTRGLVGDAECRLFGIRDYVDTLLCEIDRNPGPYWVDE